MHKETRTVTVLYNVLNEFTIKFQHWTYWINLKGEPLNFHSFISWHIWLNYLFCWMVAPEHKPYIDFDLVSAVDGHPFSRPKTFHFSHKRKPSNLVCCVVWTLFQFQFLFLFYFLLSNLFFIHSLTNSSC